MPQKPIDPNLGHCLVTGAAGLLGQNLVKTLLEKGFRVRALIYRTPLSIEHERLEIHRGDITDIEVVRAACAQIDTCFHAAASISLLGGRFATRAYRDPEYAINVGGTQNVLRACRENHVHRLIYTSSVDVCFDGRPFPGMTATAPYASHPKSVYAQTKIIAEKLVLAANGRDGLLTCAVRPDGIYGESKNLLLDEIVKQLVRGNLKAGIGDPSTLQDNSYVGNLVHGELLAAYNLTPGGVACGNAYFISDGEPQNAFEFFRPLAEALGYSLPTRRIPRWVIKPVLDLWQTLHFLAGLPAPPVAPHELDKITVSHYASNADAERDLGYKPIKAVRQALESCLPYCRELAEKAKQPRRPR